MFITRIQFLKRLWGLLLLPYALLLIVTSEKNRKLLRKREIRIPQNISPGISFFDDVIVVNSISNLKIFSSHCTHLGCKINKLHKDELVCPCHGSAFSLEGKVIRGPASGNLKELQFYINEKDHEIVIDL